MALSSDAAIRQKKQAWVWIGLAIGVGLVARVVLALVIQSYVDQKDKLCVFGDTLIYWRLAGSINSGESYQVDQSGQAHFALRTPGYPLFLASCRRLFGDRVLPIRLVQAVLNAASVALVAILASRALRLPIRRGWCVPVLAAWLAAVDPYAAALSVLALSEGTFLPLMLFSLVGLATLWPGRGEPRPTRLWLWELGTGLAMGAAIQTRPSWALIVPVLLAAWILGVSRNDRVWAIRGAFVISLTIAAVMAPWWVRNARGMGRFVPTALWVGASLYDGLSPSADGSSDMRFLEAPDIASLDEQAQDTELKRRSIEFIKARPGRALQLAAIKAARYWSLWPNADTLRSTKAAAASALWTIPTFAFLLMGAWPFRRDGRALVLLLGPLLYFLALHMVFVSSIRYRIPGMLPAYALTAVGLARAAQGWNSLRRGNPPSSSSSNPLGVVR